MIDVTVYNVDVATFVFRSQRNIAVRVVSAKKKLSIKEIN